MDAAFNLKLNEDIPLIISKASESKSEFIKFIEWYGYDKNSAEHKRVIFLVKDDNEVIEWFMFFNGDIDTLIDTTEKYKQYKIKKNSMGLQEFIARCAVNLKAGMEALFLEECPKWLENKFKDRLHSNNPLTLEFVFKINQSDKWYDSLSKIVRSNF